MVNYLNVVQVDHEIVCMCLIDILTKFDRECMCFIPDRCALR